MEAIVYSKLGEVDYTSLAEPVPAAGEVLIRVAASGICHTDIDILHGRYGNSSFPLVPGHEYAGEIIGTGPEVKRFAVGDRVVVDPNFHCGKCRACKKGLTNLCEELGAYGVSRNGGFAGLSVVHENNIVGIGDTPFHIAALAEPVGCVLNGLDAVETEGLENAVIFGCGPIGMLMALAIRTRGISDVVMVDVEEDRLALAESFGLKTVPAGSSELTGLKQSIDLVVDATGVPAVVQSLTDYVANGGRVLYFGVCPPDATITISPYDIFRRQIRIAGAHSLNHNIPEALATIDAIGADISRLISHRVPLSEVAGFLGHDRPRGALKIQAVSNGSA